MRKIKIFLVYTILFFLNSTSFADIAPSPNSYSVVPLPTDPSDSTAFNRNPFSNKQPAVDVSMAAETVFVELYPTFLKVKAVFWMKGGKTGAKNLTAGFPENIYKYHASQPLDNLIITVNDKNVTPYYYADKIYDHEAKTLWWLFNLDVPPETEVKVVVSYYQLLYDEYDNSENPNTFLSGTSEFMGGYILRTGAFWKDNIGQAKIKLITHGELDKYLTIYPSPHKSSKNIYEWEYSDWNPQSDLSLILNFPNKYIDSVSSGNAPYNFDNISPRIRFLDRLLRFNRTCILTEEKIDVLISAIVDAANQDDDLELKIYACKVLEYIRSNIEEFAGDVYKYLHSDDEKRKIKINDNYYDIQPGSFYADDFDDLLFRTGTKLGTFLYNMTINNILSSLTPKEKIGIDSSFAQDRHSKDGFERIKYYSPLIAGGFSEFNAIDLISENLFISLRQQYRTIIIIVIGLITTLFLILIYFAMKVVKNKFRKK